MEEQYHVSVLLKESVEGLNIKPDGIYVDATFGGGGHSRKILEQLSNKGRLLAFDQDADAWQNSTIEDERFIAITENFKHLKKFLKYHQFEKVDGILADLGVSSFQFDTANRGFSTRFDGPLDMRMDHRMEQTAAQILQTYNEQQLLKIFEQYGEVRNSKQLAKHIIMFRGKTNFKTIASFKAALDSVVKGNPQRYFAQVFQALRIEVNQELAVLKEFLNQTENCLVSGGRLAIITFHSLEDRIVKQYMKNNFEAENPYDLIGIKKQMKFNLITNKPIEASSEEIKINSRSRSAKLRIAEKL